MTIEELKALSPEELKAKYLEVFKKEPAENATDVEIIDALLESLNDNSGTNKEKPKEPTMAEVMETLKKVEQENATLRAAVNANTEAAGTYLKKQKPEIITEEQRLAVQKHDLNKKRLEKIKAIDGKAKTIKASEDKDTDILKDEEDRVHVLLVKQHYQAAKNKMINESKVQKIWPNVFKTMIKNLMANYDTVEILHIPKGVNLDIDKITKKAGSAQ